MFCFYSCIQYFSIYFSEKACELNFKLLPEKAIEYNYGPRFVAVGDLNNDSILDLVIAQQIVNKITVYLGEGNGNFRHRIEYSTGIHSSPCMIQLGHFNNDSQLDIAVANFGSNNIALFYGFGNGSFEQPIQFSTNSSRPIAILTADFDNDTLFDLVTANYGTNSITIHCAHTNFQSSLTYSTGDDSFPIALTPADFNNDYYMDLAIVNYGTHQICIFFANSSKIFDRQTIISTGFNSQPRSITAIDFNNDNSIDLITANYGNQQIQIFVNNGDGTFMSHSSYSTGSTLPYAIALGDFNEDHQLDIVVVAQGPNNIVLFLANGNGHLRSPRLF